MDRCALSRKASVWVALLLYTVCAVHLVAGDDQCGLACESIRTELSSSEACAKARKSLPRPKIGHLCQEAFNEAFELTCAEACRLQGTGRAPTSRLGEACDKRKRETPRPVAHKACEDGFKAGFTATKELITKKIESMKEVSRRILAEKYASLLKEEYADRERLEGIGRSEAASGARQGRIRAAEDEGAQVPHALQDGATKTVLPTSTADGDGRRADETALAESSLEMDSEIAMRPGSEQDGDASANVFATIKLSNDPRFHEVLTAEHVKGFSNRAKEGSSGIHVDKESTAAAAGTTERNPADIDLERSVELPSTGQYREVLMAEHVEGFEIHATEDAGAIQSNQLEWSAEPEGDAAADAFATIELPNDPRFREVLTAEHVKGFSNRAKKGSSGIPVDKESTAAAAGTTERNGVSADIDLERSVELPSNGHYREVLTAEHVAGFEIPAMEDAGEIQGERFGEAEAVGKEQVVGIELPNAPRYRELLVSESVKVDVTPAGEEQNDAHDCDQRPQNTRTTAVAGGSGEDSVQEADATAGEGFATITLPKAPPFREVFRAEHIKGLKPRAKEEATA